VADTSRRKPSSTKHFSPSTWGGGGARLAVFWVIAVAGLPLLLLACLELSLRAAGYGYPTRYFLEKKMDSPHGVQRYAVANPAYLLRFFPPQAARPTFPSVFPVAKPPNTVRCFVLGESSAMGEPNADAGFWRFLQTMLEAQAPERHVEFINCATPAINTHVLAAMARECIRYSPDLFLVLAGNNEVMGPFGPSSALGGHVPSVPLIRAGLLCRTFRLGQFLDKTISFVTRAKPVSSHGSENPFLGREIAATDPRLKTVRAAFRRNMDDILSTATKNGVRVVVCTVPVNLRDCPPFASMPRQDMDAAQRDEWSSRFKEGIALEKASKPAEALQAYYAAAAIDDSHAELQFHLGRLHLAAGDAEEAYRRFAAARDLDAVRLRADAALNDIVRDLAKIYSSNLVTLADVEDALRRTSPGVIPGSELFYDHIHMTPSGSYRVAQAILPVASKALSGILPDDVAAEPLTEEQCCSRLAITGWHRLRDMQAMMAALSTPPFTAQWNHAARLGALKRETSRLLRSRTQTDLLRDLRQVEQFLAEKSDRISQWGRLQEMYFELGDYAKSLESVEAALARNPLETNLRAAYGVALTNVRRAEDALRQYRLVLDATPSELIFVRSAVGGMLARGLWMLGRLDAAETQFRELLERDPHNTPLLEDLGSLYGARGDWDRAIECFDKAIENRWEASTACMALDRTLIARGDPVARIEHWRRWIERFPDRVSLHRQCAIALDMQFDLKGATEQWRKAIVLDPTDAGSVVDLANVLRRGGDTENAAREYRRAIEMDPYFTAARNGLAGLLNAQGDLEGALDVFRDPIRNNPNDRKAYEELDAFLTYRGEADLRLRECRALVRDYSDVAQAHFILARALDAASLLDSALPEYRQALTLDPDDPDKKTDLGWALQRKGYKEEAAALYAEILAQNPYHAAALNNRGLLAFDQGKLDDALPDFRAALRLTPQFEVAAENIDRVYLRRKDTEGRLREWRSLVERMPDKPLPRHRLGLALQDAGDWAGASAAFQAVLSGTPDFTPSRNALEKLMRERGSQGFDRGLDGAGGT